MVVIPLHFLKFFLVLSLGNSEMLHRKQKKVFIMNRGAPKAKRKTRARIIKSVIYEMTYKIYRL